MRFLKHNCFQRRQIFLGCLLSSILFLTIQIVLLHPRQSSSSSSSTTTHEDFFSYPENMKMSPKSAFKSSASTSIPSTWQSLKENDNYHTIPDNNAIHHYTPYNDAMTNQGKKFVRNQNTNATRNIQQDIITGTHHNNDYDDYSQIHCIGDNFLPSAWMYRSCQYRNVVHNGTHWSFFKPFHPASQQLHTLWSERVWKDLENLHLQSQTKSSNTSKHSHTSDTSFPYARCSTCAPFEQDTNFSQNRKQDYAKIISQHHQTMERRTLVSPIAMIASDFRTQKYQWTPESYSNELTFYTTTSVSNFSSLQKYEHDRIAVPIFIRRPTRKKIQEQNEEQLGSSVSNVPSIFESLTNILLPIYNLLGIFGWENEMEMVDVYILPEPTNEDNPPIHDMEDSIAWLDEVLSWLGCTMINNHDHDHNDIRIYRRMAAGMGVLSGTGFSKRGKDAKDYSDPVRAMHNAGRGRTIWEFRSHILRQSSFNGQFAANSSSSNTPQQRIKKAVLAIPMESRINSALRQNLKAYDLSMSLIQWNSTASFYESIYLAQNTDVWIANADDDRFNWPAIFMPRGSTLFLLYDDSDANSLGGRHAKYFDFGWWNHLSHLKVHWLAIPGNDEQLESLVLAIHYGIMQEGEGAGHFQSLHDPLNEFTISGSFSNLPIHFVNETLPSSKLHCVGTNWEWDSPNYLSCHIKGLCWNQERQEFAFQQDPTLSKVVKAKDSWSTFAKDKKVMMGQSVRFGTAEPWFPRLLREDEQIDSFYSLPSTTFWLPYFAEVPNANNPGHLLWDFFLPLYTLVEMFHDMPHGEASSSSIQSISKLFVTNVDSDCVIDNVKDSCYRLSRKFLSLFGINADSFSDIHSLRIHQTTHHHESPWVCAPNAAIGIGMLTDHGIKKHGQMINDYQTVRNAGRGMAIWRFRNFMKTNLLSSTTSISLSRRDEIAIKPSSFQSSQKNLKFTITFSVHSSNNPSRDRDFISQISALQHQYSSSDAIKIQSVELSRLSMEDQLLIMDESSIFVTVIGGSASTAMFLNRNSCLILFFNDEDDFVKNKRVKTKMPAMLDWDFWNHGTSYLRVHWLPMSTMENPSDLEIFSALIHAELQAKW